MKANVGASRVVFQDDCGTWLMEATHIELVKFFSGSMHLSPSPTIFASITVTANLDRSFWIDPDSSLDDAPDEPRIRTDFSSVVVGNTVGTLMIHNGQHFIHCTASPVSFELVSVFGSATPTIKVVFSSNDVKVDEWTGY